VDAFVWDSNFETGLQGVDRQHRRLVELINALGESLVAGGVASAEGLRTTFDQLADYAKQHFADEERMMRELGVDPRHCEPHKRHHAEFSAQLASTWSSRGALADPAEALHQFLRSWLGFHILGEDQVMARQIARIRAGETPERAYAAEAAPKDAGTGALLRAMSGLYQVLSQHSRSLAAANLNLEHKVAERTAELAELNKRLEALSQTDGLLGIANRRHFDQRLEAEWRRARRERRPLSLLMIDVDYFKRYNDRCGHQMGDRCLQSVVHAACAALRRPGDLLARYGGEELAALLPGTERGGAMRVGEDVVRQLADMGIAHPDSPAAAMVSVSIGGATLIPDRAGAPGQLVAAADRALYAAKAAGRNRIQFAHGGVA
jgi:diguanylate cyclase (GGDEF)-like protein/hemerythrin-like metal-binding protein